MAKNEPAKQAEANPAVRSRRFLTVEAEHHPERIDLELRGDLRLQLLFPMLITTLGWRMVNEENTIPYRLIAVTEGGYEVELKGSDTLISANIPSGSTLRVMTGKAFGTKASSSQETALFIQSAENGFSVGIPISPSPHDRRGTIAAPKRDEQIKEPSLISSSGVIFPILEKEIWVGRPHKGYRPEINLAEVDDRENPTAGRWHAQIFQEEGKYIVKPKPTLNGTFVNGTEIRPNENYVLKEGDIVRFGDVELFFRLP
jgi:hypothetical protein